MFMIFGLLLLIQISSCLQSQYDITNDMLQKISIITKVEQKKSFNAYKNTCYADCLQICNL